MRETLITESNFVHPKDLTQHVVELTGELLLGMGFTVSKEEYPSKTAKPKKRYELRISGVHDPIAINEVDDDGSTKFFLMHGDEYGPYRGNEVKTLLDVVITIVHKGCQIGYNKRQQEVQEAVKVIMKGD